MVVKRASSRVSNQNQQQRASLSQTIPLLSRITPGLLNRMFLGLFPKPITTEGNSHRPKSVCTSYLKDVGSLYPYMYTCVYTVQLVQMQTACWTKCIVVFGIAFIINTEIRFRNQSESSPSLSLSDTHTNERRKKTHLLVLLCAQRMPHHLVLYKSYMYTLYTHTVTHPRQALTPPWHRHRLTDVSTATLKLCPLHKSRLFKQANQTNRLITLHSNITSRNSARFDKEYCARQERLECWA